MRLFFNAMLLTGITGFSTLAEAGSLCDALKSVSRVEDASKSFLSSPTDIGRHTALAQMSRELDVIDDLDLSHSVFDGVRNMLVVFVHSRKNVLRQAEADGVNSALATARASSYTASTWAFDAAYSPMKCDTPTQALAKSERSEQGDRHSAQSDARQISAQRSIELSTSIMALLAFAMFGCGSGGYRLMKKGRRSSVVDRNASTASCTSRSAWAEFNMMPAFTT